MKRKVNISILCIVLIFCCILGAIPASAKLETLKFSSDGSDAELGTLAVNEKIDIDFAGVPDSFYSKWTDTDSYPEPFWTSSNSSVAGVDKNGVVTAKAAGKAVIYATFQYASNPVQTKFYVDVVKTKTPAKIVRYSGRDRFETAISVCNAGWTASTTNTVILANSATYADALVSVPLAYELNAPILLTEGRTALESNVAQQITKLKPKNIVIIGGKSVISLNIENSLKASGYSVKRCAGSDRFKTAIEIANYMTSVAGKAPTSAFVVTSNGYADALSVCSYAAISGSPILYVNNVLVSNTPTYDYIKNNNISSVTIIGGEKVINSNINNDLKKYASKVTRIKGSDRYLTSAEIAKAYKSSFGSDVMISTGLNFPDALAGGVLAAKMKVPVLLVNKYTVEAQVESYIRLSSPSTIYVLGGESVIPQSVAESLC